MHQRRDPLPIWKLWLGLMLGHQPWYRPESLGVRAVALLGVGALVVYTKVFDTSDAAVRATMGMLCAALLLTAVAIRGTPITSALFCRAGFAGAFAFLPWALLEAFGPASWVLDIIGIGYGQWMLFFAIASQDRNARYSAETPPITKLHHACTPEQALVTGPILGSYKNQSIYEWITDENGATYFFSRICASPCALQNDEIVLQPGLIYAQRIGESRH